MNTQHTPGPQQGGNDPQREPARQSGAGQPEKVSLPHNDNLQSGPFEHSGETSRQTEETREEEEQAKQQ